MLQYESYNMKFIPWIGIYQMLVQQATQFFFHSFLNVKKNEQNHFHKSISIKWYFFIFERKTSAYFMFVATQPHNRSEAKQCKKKTCKNANVSLSNRICNRPFDTRQFQLIGVFSPSLSQFLLQIEFFRCRRHRCRYCCCC